jgi:hypothetical protein
MPTNSSEKFITELPLGRRRKRINYSVEMEIGCEDVNWSKLSIHHSQLSCLSTLNLYK